MRQSSNVMSRVEKLLLVLVMIAWSYQQIVGEPLPSTTSPIPWSRTFDPAHVKLHLKPEVNQGLFRARDVIVIQTTGRGPIRVFDLRGHVVFDGNNSCKLHLPTGHYFVETDGDRTQFAVLPNDYRGAAFLGIDGEFGDDRQFSALVDRVSPTLVRIGQPLQWATVEPKRGEWDWTAADRAILVNASKGRRIIVTAGIRPQWLADDVDFLPQYVQYVRRLAQRYGNKLYAIEIWNEPWTTYDLLVRLPNPDAPNRPMTSWKQMVRTYVQVLAAARRAIKSVNPKIRVIGPAWINATNYYEVTRELANLGGLALLDGFSYHDYDDGRFAPDAHSPYQLVGVKPVQEKIQAFREIFPTNAVPIYVDEVGLLGASALGIRNTGEPEYLSGFSWYRGMCRAVKLVVLYRVAGVEALIPHVFAMGSGNPERNLEIYGWELDRRGPHPKTSAFLMACYWLSQARCTAFRTAPAQTNFSEWEQPDGKRFVIAWAAEGASPKLRLPTSLQVTDIFGQRLEPIMLGEEPLIFRWKTVPAKSSLLETVTAAIER
jgi:hypothetical protein